MSFFKRKDPEPRAVLIQPGQITLTGLHLENAVRAAVGFSADWELTQMQPLMLALCARFAVMLVTCRSGWACEISKGDILPGTPCVKEFGELSPAIALARATLVAVNEWGW